MNQSEASEAEEKLKINKKKKEKSEAELSRPTLTFLSHMFTTLFMGIFNFFFILIRAHETVSRTKRQKAAEPEFVSFAWSGGAGFSDERPDNFRFVDVYFRFSTLPHASSHAMRCDIWAFAPMLCKESGFTLLSCFLLRLSESLTERVLNVMTSSSSLFGIISQAAAGQSELCVAVQSKRCDLLNKFAFLAKNDLGDCHRARLCI